MWYSKTQKYICTVTWLLQVSLLDGISIFVCVLTHYDSKRDYEFRCMILHQCYGRAIQVDGILSFTWICLALMSPLTNILVMTSLFVAAVLLIIVLGSDTLLLAEHDVSICSPPRTWYTVRYYY